MDEGGRIRLEEVWARDTGPARMQDRTHGTEQDASPHTLKLEKAAVHGQGNNLYIK